MPSDVPTNASDAVLGWDPKEVDDTRGGKAGDKEDPTDGNSKGGR